MIDQTVKKPAGRSAIELLVAGIGGWFCISAAMSVGGGSSRASALTEPVERLMAWIGPWPTLLLSLGVAVSGAYAFLSSRAVPLERHALGSAGVGLALSLLLGAFLPTSGGDLGAVLPSLVAGALGAALGAGMGLLVLLSTLWLAWMPEGAGFYPKPGVSRALAAVETLEDPHGVSAAEAQALLADAPRATPPAPRPRLTGPQDDVRSRGGVPAGARPLFLHEPVRPPSSHSARPVAGRADADTAPADEPVGADLASREPQASSALWTGASEWAAAEAEAPADEPLTGASLPKSVRPLSEAERDQTVRPTWETTAEPEPEEEAAQKPLVLPWESPEAATALDEAGEEEDELEEEEIEEEEQPRLEGKAELEQEIEAELEEELEDEEELDEDEELEDEEDLEDGEELEDEIAEEASLEEDEESDSESDEIEADEAEDEAEEEAKNEAEDEAEEESDLYAEDETYVEEEEPEEVDQVEIPAAKPAAARPTLTQSTLFDEPVEKPAAPPARAPSPAAAAAKAPKPKKRDVVLAPEAPPEGRSPESQRDLVFEAGCLFLDENRVAVSMLQRRYGLDFEEATRVLDELQARGLIGPYLGGKTRDILMSRAEWTAAFSSV